MVTNAGGGSSRWKDLAVTRWREDGTRDNWGTFCYLRDAASGEFWSTALSADAQAGRNTTRRSSPKARAEFRRRDFDLETHTEIVVSPEDDIEVRRVHITNRSRAARDDRRHQLRGGGSRAGGRGRTASGVQQSVRANRDSSASAARSFARRRPRSLEEQVPWMFHLMTVHGADAHADLVRDGPHALHRPRRFGRRTRSRCSIPARCRTPPAPCWIRSRRSATE